MHLGRENLLSVLFSSTTTFAKLFVKLPTLVGEGEHFQYISVLFADLLTRLLIQKHLPTQKV